MEVPGGYKNKTFVLLCELIGTCFLMIVINWSSVTDTTPQCAGLAVTMLIQLFGGTSGGHFNPAVTLGMLLKEGSAHWLRNSAMAFAMIIFQGAGAALGCVICALAFDWEPSKDKKIPDTGYHVAQLCPSEGCNGSEHILRKVLFAEAVCTFMFVSNVMMIVKHNGSVHVPVNAIGIGLSLFLAIRMSSGISGGCINPAVGLFQTIFQSIANSKKYPNAEPTSWMSLGVYIGGPFLGGWFAGFWHKLIHEGAIAQAREFGDPEYEQLLAQGVYQRRPGMAEKLRAESQRRAAQAAKK
jgi:glycerol uptake facilitator-like aquaporin